MSIRLGFCGVGRWARKLAESFRACGAEIVAYDRREQSYPKPENWPHPWPGNTLEGFGRLMPWRDQLADKSIDAIVAVAPPEITTEVALACAAAGKAVMATKPLFDHPERITAPFYVDFWRLWSHIHQWAKTDESVSLVLKGSGPVRDFPGMFDYGPHVVAAVLDIADGRSVRLVDSNRMHAETGEVYAAQWMIAGETPGGTLIDAEFGNGSDDGVRSVSVHRRAGVVDTSHETPTHVGSEPKEKILSSFCQSFLSDVSEGFVDTKLLAYSREGMRMLREIREVAK